MLALTTHGTTELLDDAELEAAMERYWKARTGGDATASLKQVGDVDGDTEKDDDDPDDPPPAPPVQAGNVSTLAHERVHLHDRWLQDAGFSLPPPLFAPGTRVNALGDTNFRTERRHLEELPRFAEAAERVVGEITAEDRQTRTLPMENLWKDFDGILHVEDTKERLRFETGAFTQLAQMAGFGMGARYLQRLCPQDLRGLCVNHHLQQTPEKQVVLRTRSVEDEVRQLYAVVSPKYSIVDTDTVLRAVQDDLADARTEMVYDGSGVRATALWMPDEVVDLAAGDVFKVGVRIQTDDTGRGRIRIAGVAWRNLCLNLIIVAEGEVETVSVVHRGDPERILQTVRDGVQKARDAVGNFLQAWGHARSVRVEPEETLRSWVEDKRLLRSERDRDALLDKLLSSFREEPGDTLADCVNAVTRAAHRVPDWGFDVREQLEREAARLVYVRR